MILRLNKQIVKSYLLADQNYWLSFQSQFFSQEFRQPKVVLTVIHMLLVVTWKQTQNMLFQRIFTFFTTRNSSEWKFIHFKGRISNSRLDYPIALYFYIGSASNYMYAPNNSSQQTSITISCQSVFIQCRRVLFSESFIVKLPCNLTKIRS